MGATPAYVGADGVPCEPFFLPPVNCLSVALKCAFEVAYGSKLCPTQCERFRLFWINEERLVEGANR